MVDKKKTNNLEMEKIKLESFKVWGRIITVGITVLFGSVLVAIINYSIQDRQLEQQKLLNEKEIDLQKKKAEANIVLQEKKAKADIVLQKAKAEAERRQSEMKYLGEYISFALEDDVKKQRRFADYFAALTLSEELKANWVCYRDGIIVKQKEFDKAKNELTKAEEEKNKEKIKIKKEIVRQKQAPLESIRGKPEGSAYKLTEINGDKMVIDTTKGLMWQQSGSTNMMAYQKAEEYIAKLNINKFAGYDDWRLPTVIDAKTMIEKGLFLSVVDDVFDKKQYWIWTSDKDKEHSSRAFAVNLDYRTSCAHNMMDLYYVRAVR